MMMIMIKEFHGSKFFTLDVMMSRRVCFGGGLVLGNKTLPY